jgi:hypothetical protein
MPAAPISIQEIYLSLCPCVSVATKRRRPVFNGTGTPACAPTSTEFPVQARSSPDQVPMPQKPGEAIQTSEFLLASPLPHSHKKKRRPVASGGGLKSLKLVCFPTLPASPCQNTQIDNTHNNSKRSRPSGSSPSCAKAYTRFPSVSNRSGVDVKVGRSRTLLNYAVQAAGRPKPALTCPYAVA